MKQTFIGVSLCAGAASALAVALEVPRAPLLVNETPSLPTGVYLRLDAPAATGRVVAFVPPPQARRYLAALGAADDAMLLKRVAASAGETACARDGQLVWPRGTVAALALDRSGRRLPAWRGCRKLASDELLVIGDTPTSFDSRYFGPVRTSAVEGVYQEVWRW